MPGRPTQLKAALLSRRLLTTNSSHRFRQYLDKKVVDGSRNIASYAARNLDHKSSSLAITSLPRSFHSSSPRSILGFGKDSPSWISSPLSFAVRLQEFNLRRLRQSSISSSPEEIEHHLRYYEALIGDNPNINAQDLAYWLQIGKRLGNIPFLAKLQVRPGLSFEQVKEELALEMIESFEKLTKFWDGFDVPEGQSRGFPTAVSPLLLSEKAWNIYLRALTLVDQEIRIDQALVLVMERRKAILEHFNISLEEIQKSEAEAASTITKEQLIYAVLQKRKPSVAKSLLQSGFLSPRLPKRNLIFSASTQDGYNWSTTSGARAYHSSTTTPRSHWPDQIRMNSTAPSPKSTLNVFEEPVASKPFGSWLQHKQSNTIKLELSETGKGFWSTTGKTLVSALVWGVVAIFLMSYFFNNGAEGSKRGAGGPASLFGMKTKDFKVSKPTTTFADVHGCDEAKDDLVEFVEFLRNPAKYSRLGGKLPKGILLMGEPGVGKTHLARAVAGEAGVNFFAASGSDFEEMFVGVGARRVRDLFESARENTPAIIFIDEIDAVGGKRRALDHSSNRQTLNEILNQMDGFTASEAVIVIAATNFPDALDPALVRPGRFDKKVSVPLPDVRGRMKIVKHYLKGILHDPKLDLQEIARGTVGFSGADLENLCNQAAVKASNDNAEMVTNWHLHWARDKILMGAERKSTFITEESKLKTAYHEAGHALVALFNPHSDPLHLVTIMPRGNALGVTWTLPKMDKYDVSYLELLAHLERAMGGRAAEELIYGKDNITSGASSDINSATGIATKMVTNYGFSDKIGKVAIRKDDVSAQTKNLVDSEVKRLIEEAHDRTMNLLVEKRVELDRLAHALVEYETLDLHETELVIKGEPLTRKKRELENLAKAGDGENSKISNNGESTPNRTPPSKPGGEGDSAPVPPAPSSRDSSR